MVFGSDMFVVGVSVLDFSADVGYAVVEVGCAYILCGGGAKK